MILAQDLTKWWSECLLLLQSFGGKTGAGGFTSKLTHMFGGMY